MASKNLLLKSLIVRRFDTVERFAKRARITPGFVSLIISRDRMPSLGVALRMAELLGTDIRTLFENEGPERKVRLDRVLRKDGR